MLRLITRHESTVEPKEASQARRKVVDANRTALRQGSDDQNSREMATIGRKHETEGHGGQVTNDPARHLAGAPIEYLSMSSLITSFDRRCRSWNGVKRIRSGVDRAVRYAQIPLTYDI